MASSKLSIYLDVIGRELPVTILEADKSGGRLRVVLLGRRYVGTISYRPEGTHTWRIIDVDAEVGEGMTRPCGFDQFETAVRQVLSLWVESKLGEA